MKIVVAMSGGVDSSTAAGLLVEAGHEVIGLAMKTHSQANKANRACCTPDDMRDAQHVADMLQIPFYVLNYEDIFYQTVIKPFAIAYQEGRTPNPCVVCNDKVKFAPLLARARLLGADALATGHYARIHQSLNGPMLQRAVDLSKDQAYFLYRLTPEQLSQTMFPLGGLTKQTVREHAARLGLPVANKAESQEICFVGARGYAATVEQIIGKTESCGPIVDKTGKVLGQHQGIHHFTLGQRRGLGLASTEPWYVIHIDAATATVTVGREEDLQMDSMFLEDVVWNAQPPQPHIAWPQTVFIQPRYRSQPQAATLTFVDTNRVHIAWSKLETKGAPGQAAVIYNEQGVVLGGGVIEHAPLVSTSHTTSYSKRLPIVHQT